MFDAPLLPSLEPRITRLLDRHTTASARIDWSYREYLPLEAYHAPSEHRRLSEAAYVAVETALLTEANLPWYTAVLYEGLKTAPEPIQEFVKVWTSEEDQHSTLLETYLLLTDNGDHAERGKSRRAVLAGGWTHNLRNQFEAMVYTTVQELATQAFYLCTARVCERDDPALAAALRRIAKDETRHYAFYRDVVKAHLEVDPDYVEPIASVITQFRMPGNVISDFSERATLLSGQDVFGPQDFYRDVVEVVCAFWNLDSIAPSRPEAQQALSRLNRYRTVLQKLATRQLANLEVASN